jgi:AcrR family transcriptional regulator
MASVSAPQPISAPDPQDSGTETSDRFRAKRDRILDAAAQIINEKGLRGLTFVSVAELVEMNTTSITYYFKRKELLAAATLERSIEDMLDAVTRSAREATPEARVSRLVRIVLDNIAEERTGTRPARARLSDMRALNEELRDELGVQYMNMFRQVVDFFDVPRGDKGREIAWARTHVLLDTLHWCRIWISKYSVGDYDRVHARLMELYRYGYATDDAQWAPVALDVQDIDDSTDEINRETYLRAATVTINERGYRGASVERIAAFLNVSKGSFYHHLDGKDDLVLDCFDRSYGRVSRVQRAAMALPGTWWDRLSAATATLTEVQFDSRVPLLRITALTALPREMRGPILRRSDRMAQRFAGMMIDGITEGSIRPIDPLIASQCLVSSLNSAFDFRRWAEHRSDPETAIRLYSQPLAFGLFGR